MKKDKPDLKRLQEYVRLVRLREDLGISTSSVDPIIALSVGGEAGGVGELHLVDLEEQELTLTAALRLLETIHKSDALDDEGLRDELRRFLRPAK